MAETKKYKVLNPVDHDGKKYKKGEDVSLPDNQAKPLLKLGYINIIATQKKDEGDKGNSENKK